MERGSDKHGPMRDDALEKDVDGMLRGDHPTRAEEALDAEPSADDDPDLVHGNNQPDESDTDAHQ